MSYQSELPWAEMDGTHIIPVSDTKIDLFTQTMKHSFFVHNNPHVKFLENDLYLAEGLDEVYNFATGQGDFVVPVGGIIMWSGSIASIPSGWVLCDGTNGTPDLRGKFVLGAASTNTMLNPTLYSNLFTGSSGTRGEETHVLIESEMPRHFHNSQYDWRTPGSIDDIGSGSEIAGFGQAGTVYTYPTTTAGASAAHNNMPPYFALAFIMKTA